jgi:hypothetical protein
MLLSKRQAHVHFDPSGILDSGIVYGFRKDQEETLDGL